MGILEGKRALIVGVATDRSIAWGIAQAMHAHGAQLAFTYANDRFRERVEPLAQSLGERLTMPLDVTVDEQIEAMAARLTQEWGQLDILVHAVAFAPREAIDGSFTANTSREAFRIAHDISSYSVTGLAKASLEANVRFLAADLGPRDIRVNGISAGPIKTLSGAGVGGFRKMLGYVARVAPLRRNVSIEDVGNAATFLCSGMAAGVTGEILYVDSGFSTVGMSFADEAGTE